MTQDNNSLYFCPFSRAILNGQSKCQHAISAHIAERHNINCSQESTSLTCQALIEATFVKAKFVLKTATGLKSIPSAKKNRLQMGLVTGLQEIVAQENLHSDIYDLIVTAKKDHGSLESLPFERLVTAVKNCKPRISKRTKK
jgi:hypothetical protein